jgi:peroxiredoxin
MAHIGIVVRREAAWRGCYDSAIRSRTLRAKETPMASLVTPPGQLGMTAPDFDLPGVDGRRHTLDSVRGPNGTLVMFICNHCPYVKAVIDKIVRDTAELATHGIGSIAISSNDPVDYPEDSFDNMKAFAARHRLAIPYAFDESQAIAKAYGAVCTPDFFGFARDGTLAYRGRLDSAGRLADAAAPRELFAAMSEIARTGRGPATQHASIGCSIKWKQA